MRSESTLEEHCFITFELCVSLALCSEVVMHEMSARRPVARLDIVNEESVHTTIEFELHRYSNLRFQSG